MDIYSYHIDSDNLVLDGVCGEWFEVLWTRRFFKGDDFTITLPPTPRNVKLFSVGRVIELDKINPLTKESEHAGVITAVSITSGEKSTLTISGQSFDGLLDRRILSEYEYDDTAMTVLRKNAGDLAIKKRRFAATTFDTTVDTATYQTGAKLFKTLAEYVSNIAENKGWGLQAYIAHNVAAPHIVIRGQQSVDRSVNQAVAKRVVFSDVYETAADFERQYSESGAVTGVVVGSKAQHNDTSHIDVEKYVGFFGDAQSYERIEKYQGITPTTKTEIRGETAWTILDEGKTTLAAAEAAGSCYISATDYFSSDVVIRDGWETKFAVGDIVTVQNTEWDMTADKQVTEIQEYWGADNNTITVTLGNPPKTLAEILRKGD